MLAFERVLRIRACRPDGKLSVGSATLISQRLVLTAAHVVVDRVTRANFSDVEVAFHGVSDFYSSTTVWTARSGLDAALIKITDPRWTPSLTYPVRLGRATGLATGLPIESIGFPRVLRGPDQTRDTEQLNGTLNPGTVLDGERYDISLASAVPDRGSEPEDPSPWAGLSGAGLTSGQLLIGVVTQDTEGFGPDRLTAIPVYALIADPVFRRLLSDAGRTIARGIGRVGAAARSASAPATAVTGHATASRPQDRAVPRKD